MVLGGKVCVCILDKKWHTIFGKITCLNYDIIIRDFFLFHRKNVLNILKHFIKIDYFNEFKIVF